MTHELGLDNCAQLSLFSPVMQKRLVVAPQISAYWSPGGVGRVTEGVAQGKGASRMAAKSTGDVESMMPPSDMPPGFKRTRAKLATGSLLPKPTK